ncbi:MAG: lipoyl(octanoyl) transferase LipB [Anaplasma sp.]
MEWRVSSGLTDYAEALSFMTSRIAGIAQGREDEVIWFLEHSPVYTRGVSAKDGDLLSKDVFPVVSVSRGGGYSYHGPGQRVVYVMMDLKRRKLDIRSYVRCLGLWAQETLSEFVPSCYFDSDTIGVWVSCNGVEKKIAAFGVAVRKWVSYHGFAVNICTNLGDYNGIVPCGMPSSAVTSLEELGVRIPFEGFDAALRRKFAAVFLHEDA